MHLLLATLAPLAWADPADALDALPTSAELPAAISEAELSPHTDLSGPGLGERESSIGDGGTAAPTGLTLGSTTRSVYQGRPLGPRPYQPCMYGPSAPIVMGPLDACVLRDRLKPRMPHIGGCYDRALESTPNLRGKITVKFIIDPSGAVSSAEIRSTTLDHPEMEACVVGVISRTMFDPIENGGIVIVSYPFYFSR